MMNQTMKTSESNINIRNAEIVSDNLQDELASDIYFTPLRASLQNLRILSIEVTTLSLLLMTKDYAISAEGACRDGASSSPVSDQFPPNAIISRTNERANKENPESFWACALRRLNRLLLSQTNLNESIVNRRSLQVQSAISGGMWMEPRIAV